MTHLKIGDFDKPAEIRRNAEIQVPEGCTFPDGYIECMTERRRKRSFTSPLADYDLEGICYEIACT